MKIRIYRNGDEQAISDLIHHALHNHRYDFKGQNPRLIEKDILRYSSNYIRELGEKAELYLATHDTDEKDILGIACLEKAELSACYVRGDMQKKGIGKALIEHLEKAARKNNIKKICLYSNFYSEPFYKSLGFQLIERKIIDYYGISWNASYMEKKLSD